MVTVAEDVCKTICPLGSFVAFRETLNTQPSEQTRTMSACEESLTAWCLEDLLPLMHMTADLRMAVKDSLHLNQPMREL